MEQPREACGYGGLDGRCGPTSGENTVTVIIIVTITVTVTTIKVTVTVTAVTVAVTVTVTLATPSPHSHLARGHPPARRCDGRSCSRGQSETPCLQTGGRSWEVGGSVEVGKVKTEGKAVTGRRRREAGRQVAG